MGRAATMTRRSISTKKAKSLLRWASGALNRLLGNEQSPVAEERFVGRSHSGDLVTLNQLLAWYFGAFKRH
jgi:hypothetical protein